MLKEISTNPLELIWVEKTGSIAEDVYAGLRDAGLSDRSHLPIRATSKGDRMDEFIKNEIESEPKVSRPETPWDSVIYLFTGPARFEQDDEFFIPSWKWQPVVIPNDLLNVIQESFFAEGSDWVDLMERRNSIRKRWLAMLFCKGFGLVRISVKGNKFKAEAAQISHSLSPRPASTSSGVERIAAERKRQVEVEGWTAEHDVKHDTGDLARAAIHYAYEATRFRSAARWNPNQTSLPIWPFGIDQWKPSSTKGLITMNDAIRMLEKAGALIAAEIDRFLYLKELREGREASGK